MPMGHGPAVFNAGAVATEDGLSTRIASPQAGDQYMRAHGKTSLLWNVTAAVAKQPARMATLRLRFPSAQSATSLPCQG